MLSAIRRHKDRESGFTLIELLVVILIIGILSAIAVPAFMNQRKSANESALRSDMKNMATEMYSYYSKNSLEKSQPSQSKTESGSSAVAGWAVLVRSDGASFAGDRNNNVDSNVYMQDQKAPIAVSDGVGIGVATQVSAVRGWAREYGEFCIVGNATGSDYELPASVSAGTSAFAYALYYDSAEGGFLEAKDLTIEGACGPYKERIDAGT